MTIIAGAGMLFTAALTMASAEVAAQPSCNQRDSVIGHLAQKYREAPIAIGVTNQGGLVEVLSTGDGKTWTIIVSMMVHVLRRSPVSPGAHGLHAVAWASPRSGPSNPDSGSRAA